MRASSTLIETSRAPIRRSRNVVSRVVAEEAIVVPIRRGAADMDSIFTFNEAGTALWSMVEEGRNVAEMADQLRRSYGISAEQAEEDAKRFVSELAEAGLIEQE